MRIEQVILVTDTVTIIQIINHATLIETQLLELVIVVVSMERAIA